MNCPICKSQSIERLRIQAEFSVLECQRCKFGLVDPIPNAEELTALYNNPKYFEEHTMHDFGRITSEEIEREVEKASALHWANIREFVNPRTTLLEIGCGAGFALEALRRRGLSVRGLELSESAVSFSRRLGISVQQGSLESASLDKRYEVVMMNHVLEHFVDIHDAMQRILRLLEPGGLLYIRVPDHDSYDRRRYGVEWPAYLPFHISYFSEDSLRKLFEDNGLEIVRVDRFLSEKFLKGAPRFVRRPGRALAARALVRQFSGRTITMIGRKKGSQSTEPAEAR